MIINRNEAIAANQDPFGKTWGVRLFSKELSFWVICIKNAANELVIPTVYPRGDMEGKWTRIGQAKEAINVYLNEAWDMADEEAKKQARKPSKAEQVVEKAVA
jgi:hypothetical protein